MGAEEHWIFPSWEKRESTAMCKIEAQVHSVKGRDGNERVGFVQRKEREWVRSLIEHPIMGEERVKGCVQIEA